MITEGSGTFGFMVFTVTLVPKELESAAVAKSSRKECTNEDAV